MVILWVCCGYHLVWYAICPEFRPDLGQLWEVFWGSLGGVLGEGVRGIVQKLNELFAKIKYFLYLCTPNCVVVHELIELNRIYCSRINRIKQNLLFTN